MRKYETIFIVKPDLGEEATEAVVEKMTTLIADNGGEVANTDKWGTKELAYEINDYTTGYYTVINFTGEPATIEELERIYKLDDNVLRYLILRNE
ncbi:30S ribosomal protein S6 [Orenia marismortui]|uniref:Small ribosomal subunit protein bS6 n=1 Tax=Orenia marismortui TaxID=46469 RepID=A0A4R8GYW9_9FIRM|nr:30S ribosomal protein S6 [Orenia marismortui]TDX51794.1 small subunit ribosomal protein S6 [Orenia marismortui]